MSVEPPPQSVGDYVDLISRRVRFAQANYGDGEWSCVLGYTGRNCNGEAYTPALRRALIRTLTEPGLDWIGSTARGRLAEPVRQWIGQHGVAAPIIDRETLPSANCQGRLGPLIAALRKASVLQVGPEHLARLDVLGCTAFVEVPSSDAFAEVEDTISTLKVEIELHQPDIVLFSSGMAANVMIHQLARELDSPPAMLDCGALWDPYVGVNSRKGYRKPGWPDRMALNLKEADELSK